MPEQQRHTDPIPNGWEVDEDDWLKRRVRHGDRERMALFENMRVFIEKAHVYCAEVSEALIMDGRGSELHAEVTFRLPFPAGRGKLKG